MQPRIRLGKWDVQNSLGFWYTNRSSNLGQTTRPSNNQQFRIVDFVVSVDHRVKLKEKRRDKYLDLAREQNKTIEHDNDRDTSFNWCPQFSHQRFGTRTGGVGYKRESIGKIDQNPEKSL